MEGDVSAFDRFISDFAVIADSACRRKQLQVSSNVGKPESLVTDSAFEVSWDALWHDGVSPSAFRASR